MELKFSSERVNKTSCIVVTGLPSLSALNSSTAGLGEINPANLQSLASLANFSAGKLAMQLNININPQLLYNFCSSILPRFMYIGQTQ